LLRAFFIMSKRFLYSLQIITLTIWVSCLIGAAVGFGFKQEWVMTFAKKPQTLALETRIELSTDDRPKTETATDLPAENINTETSTSPPPTMPVLAEMTPLPDIPEIPEAPVPVITKNATKVASEPVKKMTNSAPTTQNKPTTAKPSSAAAASDKPPGSATTLSFGSGAGRQPAPVYPLQSRRSNQQGTVTVEFIVGTDGKVLSAWVKRACAFEALNNAAVSTIRSRWKFPAGAARRYQIPIVFRLQ
jgi:protein TonB